MSNSFIELQWNRKRYVDMSYHCKQRKEEILNSSVTLRSNIGNDQKKRFYLRKQKYQIVSLNYIVK